jgi:hypothetical protein
MQTNNKVSLMFRALGSLILIVGVIQFLISGRYDLNSYLAHNLFLGLNTILCGLGILSAKKLKDNKTARTFLTLSLAMLPTQFAQLGAFVFNRINGIPTEIPEMAQIILPDTVGLVSVAVMTGIILLPILLLGFHVINRDEAKKLSLLYGVHSALLLLPIRDNFYIFGIVAVMIVSLFFLFRDLKPAVTLEYRISRYLMFIPTSLIISRGMMYSNSSMMYAIAFYLFGYFSMVVTPNFLKEFRPGELLSTLSYRLGNLSIFTGTLLVCLTFKLGYIPSIFILSGISYLMGTFGKYNDPISTAVGHFLFVFGGVLVLDKVALIWQYVYLIAPLIASYISYQAKNKISFGIHSVNAIVLTLIIFSKSFSFGLLGNWQSLSACGIVLILIGALYERKSSDLKKKIELFTLHFN